MAKAMKVVQVSDLRIERTKKLWEGKEDKKEDKVVAVDDLQPSRHFPSIEEIRENDKLKEDQEESATVIKKLKKENKELKENGVSEEDYEELRKENAETITELKNVILELQKKKDKKDKKDGKVS